jgi:hypothetical protein
MDQMGKAFVAITELRERVDKLESLLKELSADREHELLRAFQDGKEDTST